MNPKTKTLILLPAVLALVLVTAGPAWSAPGARPDYPSAHASWTSAAVVQWLQGFLGDLMSLAGPRPSSLQEKSTAGPAPRPSVGDVCQDCTEGGPSSDPNG
jgi:hypothetical protein